MGYMKRFLRIVLFLLKIVMDFSEWLIDDDPFTSTFTRAVLAIISGIVLIAGPIAVGMKFNWHPLSWILLPYCIFGAVDYILGLFSAVIHISMMLESLYTNETHG